MKFLFRVLVIFSFFMLTVSVDVDDMLNDVQANLYGGLQIEKFDGFKLRFTEVAASPKEKKKLLAIFAAAGLKVLSKNRIQGMTGAQGQDIINRGERRRNPGGTYSWRIGNTGPRMIMNEKQDTVLLATNKHDLYQKVLNTEIAKSKKKR